MTRPTYFAVGVVIVCLITSCQSTNGIAGTYRSNFAVHGFFVTRISLHADSTFGYRESGDMMFDTSNGHYKLEHKYLVLCHEPFKPNPAENQKYGKDAVLSAYALSTNKHLGRPEKYLVRHDKLFVSDTFGKVIKKQFGYSQRKQYLLFGKHWYKRQYYLKRDD